MKREIVLILPDIRSAQNVGAIFRTADAVGVSHIIMCGYTPAPIDKFGRIRQDICKTALGAEDSVKWSVEMSAQKAIKSLRKDGFKIVALEQTKNSIDFKKYKPSKKTALIVGNEVLGIDKKLLKLCDKIIELPMSGLKESLNVSVATGIALYHLRG